MIDFSNLLNLIHVLSFLPINFICFFIIFIIKKLFDKKYTYDYDGNLITIEGNIDKKEKNYYEDIPHKIMNCEKKDLNNSNKEQLMDIVDEEEEFLDFANNNKKNKKKWNFNEQEFEEIE